MSFFSDEAFHYYLPAHPLADPDGPLKQSDPVFHLTHGLERGSREEKVNPRRYGERTWFDHARHRCSMFNARERAAIVAFLTSKRGTDALTDLEKPRMDDAIGRHWTIGAS